MKFYETPKLKIVLLESEENLLTSAELPDDEYSDSDRDIDVNELF